MDPDFSSYPGGMDAYMRDNFGTQNSAAGMFYGYQTPDSDSSYAGHTYGSAYGGGTNGSSYGGWTSTDPLSGNNAFSGNRGSSGHGPTQGYDPRMGMANHGSLVGNPSMAWNLGSVGGDPTGGGDGQSSPPANTANQDIQRFLAGNPGLSQASSGIGQAANSMNGAQDSSGPSDRLLRNNIGGQGGIDGYGGGQKFSTNDEGYNPPSNGQATYNQKAASMQDYMNAHGVGFFGDPSKDYGYGGGAGASIGNSVSNSLGDLSGGAGTQRYADGHSDWTEEGQAPIPSAWHDASLNPQPSFNPGLPTASPFGGVQSPNQSSYADDFQHNQKTLNKLGFQSLGDYSSYRDAHPFTPNAAASAGPDSPGVHGDPTNNSANYKHGQYTGPAAPGMDSVTPIKDASINDINQQRKGLQMQPSQTIAPFSGTPVSSNFSAQDPNSLIASNYDLGNNNVFNQQLSNSGTPYKPGASQADPVLDGLLQQLQTTHDPATINKIMKMINPSGSKSNNLKGMA